MENEEKEYVSFRRLATFLEKLKGLFLTKEEVQDALDDKSQVKIIIWDSKEPSDEGAEG